MMHPSRRYDLGRSFDVGGMGPRSLGSSFDIASITHQHKHHKSSSSSNSNNSESIGDDVFSGIEKAIKLTFNEDTRTWESKLIEVQIAKTPFDRGIMHNAHKCIEYDGAGGKSSNRVAKFLDGKSLGAKITKQMYFDEATGHLMANRYALEFNTKSPQPIHFCPIHLLELIERPAKPMCRIEPMLEGMWVKHNNNSGGVLSNRMTPQAFSHYTLEASNGEHLVCDIQGVSNNFTDPQIHTKDGRGFGLGNTGDSGIKKFLQSHTCNVVCAVVGLPRLHKGAATHNWTDREIPAEVFAHWPESFQKKLLTMIKEKIEVSTKVMETNIQDLQYQMQLKQLQSENEYLHQQLVTTEKARAEAEADSLRHRQELQSFKEQIGILLDRMQLFFRFDCRHVAKDSQSTVQLLRHLSTVSHIVGKEGIQWNECLQASSAVATNSSNGPVPLSSVSPLVPSIASQSPQKQPLAPTAKATTTTNTANTANTTNTTNTTTSITNTTSKSKSASNVLAVKKEDISAVSVLATVGEDGVVKNAVSLRYAAGALLKISESETGRSQLTKDKHFVQILTGVVNVLSHLSPDMTDLGHSLVGAVKNILRTTEGFRVLILIKNSAKCLTNLLVHSSSGIATLAAGCLCNVMSREEGGIMVASNPTLTTALLVGLAAIYSSPSVLDMDEADYLSVMYSCAALKNFLRNAVGRQRFISAPQFESIIAVQSSLLSRSEYSSGNDVSVACSIVGCFVDILNSPPGHVALSKLPCFQHVVMQLILLVSRPKLDDSLCGLCVTALAAISKNASGVGILLRAPVSVLVSLARIILNTSQQDGKRTSECGDTIAALLTGVKDNATNNINGSSSKLPQHQVSPNSSPSALGTTTTTVSIAEGLALCSTHDNNNNNSNSIAITMNSAKDRSRIVAENSVGEAFRYLVSLLNHPGLKTMLAVSIIDQLLQIGASVNLFLSAAHSVDAAISSLISLLVSCRSSKFQNAQHIEALTRVFCCLLVDEKGRKSILSHAQGSEVLEILLSIRSCNLLSDGATINMVDHALGEVRLAAAAQQHQQQQQQQPKRSFPSSLDFGFMSGFAL